MALGGSHPTKSPNSATFCPKNCGLRCCAPPRPWLGIFWGEMRRKRSLWEPAALSNSVPACTPWRGPAQRLPQHGAVPHYEFLELKLERQRAAYLRDKLNKALAKDVAS
ncbi:hypothetical protein LUU34_01420700 [Aix galericulata]|nr:hypothetical protein LUU34_01420700 [Aix galericulata]